MDGQMPAALTSWVAPVTGVLNDCAGSQHKKMGEIHSDTTRCWMASN